LSDCYFSEAHFFISFLLYARASSTENVLSGFHFKAAFFATPGSFLQIKARIFYHQLSGVSLLQFIHTKIKK